LFPSSSSFLRFKSLVFISEFKFCLVNTLINFYKIKTYGPPHRKEATNIVALDAKPKVSQLLKDDGCYNLCRKLQEYHDQVVMTFAKSFDGVKAQVRLR